jgi:hypothetical protein
LSAKIYQLHHGEVQWVLIQIHLFWQGKNFHLSTYVCLLTRTYVRRHVHMCTRGTKLPRGTANWFIFKKLLW